MLCIRAGSLQQSFVASTLLVEQVRLSKGPTAPEGVPQLLLPQLLSLPLLFLFLGKLRSILLRLLWVHGLLLFVACLLLLGLWLIKVSLLLLIIVEATTSVVVLSTTLVTTIATTTSIVVAIPLSIIVIISAATMIIVATASIVIIVVSTVVSTVVLTIWLLLMFIRVWLL